MGGNIRNYEKGISTDTPVSTYFKQMGHKQAQLKWLILENSTQLKSVGNIKKSLLQREAYWSKKINTMFPLGTNDY
ncbi:hypothetical protein XELAEV_18012388mg [Xenopus laevis]|uniref:Uncharacterized protein n=1 Tax=Xenopus laevis TaxID=8355 RepID=A0A974DPV0_XENLA|nr:hypothetical protein XELAEV_18012388mg [Xenopus laevis]